MPKTTSGSNAAPSLARTIQAKKRRAKNGKPRPPRDLIQKKLYSYGYIDIDLNIEYLCGYDGHGMVRIEAQFCLTQFDSNPDAFYILL
ncbi:unnamed protein product [Didymodactylos carnosus]|uniref:Uncharacterized protein n=1 Tax=Didymodactylos carnosus TaxID=1234261 RepID=A0A814KBP6_9BILA|nr:unnamed protein product [Didymodactylos carnosus]CAF3818924.1 unnamed protein product [Didymodactylos carnosus]